MSAAAPPLCEAFAVLADLCLALGEAPINRLPGVWVHQVDEHWRVAVNGHNEPVTAEGVEIAPFRAVLWRDGWPAGILDPSGGVLVGGPEAEDAFIEACRVATEAAGALR